MTLTPEQRAASIEAMARALCHENGFDTASTRDLGAEEFQPAWTFYREDAADALDAALPIIKAAMASDKPVGENG